MMCWLMLRWKTEWRPKAVTESSSVPPPHSGFYIRANRADDLGFVFDVVLFCQHLCFQKVAEDFPVEEGAGSPINDGGIHYEGICLP